MGGTGNGGGKDEKLAMITLVIAIITSFAGTFSASAINIAIPQISAEFGSNAELTGWVLTGFLVGAVIFSVPFGRLADLTGRKRIYALGVVIFAVTSLACAITDSIWIIIAIRILQGAGAAMYLSTNIAVMVDAQPPQKKGGALGIVVATSYIGLSVGPTLGGVLVTIFGWKSIFITMLVISGSALIPLLAKLPNDSKRIEGGSFDVQGSLLYIVAITPIFCGLSLWASHNWAIALIPAGFLIGVFFVKHELKRDNPVLDIRLLAKNRNYTFSNLAALLNYAFSAGLTYYLSIHLQVVMGLNPMVSGIIMVGQPLCQAAVSPYAGRLSDRVSPFKVATVGMAICAASLLGFCFISASSPLAYVIVLLILIGVGFGVFSSPNSNAIMSCVGPEDYGSATAFQGTMRNMGQTASLAIATSILALHIGDTTLVNAPVSALVLSMRTGFIIFTILCVLGVFFSMQRKGTVAVGRD